MLPMTYYGQLGIERKKTYENPISKTRPGDLLDTPFQNKGIKPSHGPWKNIDTEQCKKKALSNLSSGQWAFASRENQAENSFLSQVGLSSLLTSNVLIVITQLFS